MEVNYYEWVPAYVNGRLTSDQRSEFETEMERDKELRIAVKEFPDVLEAINAAAEEDAKQLIDRIRKSAGTPAKHVLVRRPWMIAASILILAIAGTVTFVNVNYSTAALISGAYEAPADLGSLKSDGQSNPDWDAIIQAWGDGDQERAISLADTFAAGHPDDADVTRRIAHLHFQTGEYTEALASYNRIRDDRLYGDYADFQYALTLIELRRESEALSVLDTIAQDDNHRFHEKAERLQSKLGSLWHRLAFR